MAWPFWFGGATVNSKFEFDHEQALEYWAKTAVMMWMMIGLNKFWNLFHSLSESLRPV